MNRASAIILLVLAGSAYAQEEPQSASERGSFGCVPLDLSSGDADFTFEISTHFAAVQRSAVQLNAKFCDALNNPVANELPIADLGAFGLFAEAEANSRFLGTGEQSGVSDVMRAFASSLNRGNSFPVTMPDLETIPSDDARGGGPDPIGYALTTRGSVEQVIDSDSDATCISKSGVSCSTLILDLDHALQPYKRSYQVFVTDKNAVLLTGLQSDWNDFFDTGRSMTTLDLFFTSIMERKHMRQGFLVGPVKRQWFALHPNVIMQYTDISPKGERFKAGLSIEWFGVNYWQDSILGIPLGASLTSVYSDRADLKSVGHGLTLHFDNRFTVGWTTHGSEDAFHISADLLALFIEKKNAFENYKDKVLSLK